MIEVGAAPSQESQLTQVSQEPATSTTCAEEPNPDEPDQEETDDDDEPTGKRKETVEMNPSYSQSVRP